MKLFKNRSQQRELRQQLETHRDKLFRVAYSWSHDPHIADDLVQQSLVKALQNLEKLRSADVLNAWLFRILANCWKDHLRSQKETVDIDESDLAGGKPLDEVHHQEQIVDRVRKAIATLPEAQKQVITLVDLAGLTYNEVSEVLEVPIGTVMSRVCRARQSLRTHLVEFRHGAETTGPRLRRVK